MGAHSNAGELNVKRYSKALAAGAGFLAALAVTFFPAVDGAVLESSIIGLGTVLAVIFSPANQS